MALRAHWMLLGCLVCATAAHAQQPGVLGQWREPGGSVVEVVHCNADLCLRIVEISPTAPARVDHHNPDPALRTRTLCGLQIGYGFHPKDADHADDGKLYDPKTGKSYSGMMWVEGGKLHLRGWVGVKALGRTEVWERVQGIAACRM